MKSPTSLAHRMSALSHFLFTGQVFRIAAAQRAEMAATDEAHLSPQAAQRLLYALMFPSMLMPLISSMTRVALPIIRDDFQIQADMTAWVSTSFTLPFMILMPVYGRLSDGVGKRRLILAGIVIFTLGTVLTVTATTLAWVMVGRAIQGIGSAGFTPLGMALLSTVFPKDERGKALGTWSAVGPATAFISPLVAGFIIAAWGWRAAFAPGIILGVLTLFVVRQYVPAGLSTIRPRFWRNFDWIGAALLAVTITFFLFYLSSRPITGVAALHDWRLLAVMLLAFGLFLWWEQRRHTPFVKLGIFANRLFSLACLCAALRMFTMAGSSFLIPLYLVDIHGFNPTRLGFMLMIMPAGMSIMVRFGGQIADRWGSRLPVMIGLVVQGMVMILFAWTPETASLWMVGGLLAVHGLGVGLMLAALHRAAMGHMPEGEMGSAAGLYSMIRFIGMATGTAIAGVLLQLDLDQGLATILAYQNTFIFFVGSAIAGLVVASGLRERD